MYLVMLNSPRMVFKVTEEEALGVFNTLATTHISREARFQMAAPLVLHFTRIFLQPETWYLDCGVNAVVCCRWYLYMLSQGLGQVGLD